MVNRDGDLRRSEPDAVHKVRVATRRLRSVLSTFRAMFDRSVTDPLREELSWLARSVGAVRDVEVQRLSLLEAVAAEPDDLVMGGVRGRIEVEMQSDYRAAHDHLLLDLDSARYFRLLDRLDDVVSAPPFTELAWRKGRTVLEKRLRHACARLYTLASADEPPAGTGRTSGCTKFARRRSGFAMPRSLPGLSSGRKLGRWQPRRSRCRKASACTRTASLSGPPCAELRCGCTWTVRILSASADCTRWSRRGPRRPKLLFGGHGRSGTPPT